MILMIRMNLKIVKLSCKKKVIESLKIHNSMMKKLTAALNLKSCRQLLAHMTSLGD